MSISDINENDKDSDIDLKESNDLYQKDSNPIVEYYLENNFPMVYKKFDNTNCNTIPYKSERYYSSVFFDVKKFL